jgi:hypothetical protein
MNLALWPWSNEGEVTEGNDAWFDLDVGEISSNDIMEMRIVVRFHLIQILKIWLLLDLRSSFL